MVQKHHHCLEVSHESEENLLRVYNKMTLTPEDIIENQESFKRQRELEDFDVRNKARQEFANKVADELEPLDDEKTGDYLWRMQQLQKTLRGNGK